MTLERRVELLHRSINRIMKAVELGLPRSNRWWWYMRRWTWMHFKQTLGLLWIVRRKG